MKNEFFKDIPSFKKWKSVTQINKGWSSDTKYHIVDIDNNEFVLRVSDVKLLKQKEQEYHIVKLLSELDIPMSMPIDFGICNNGGNVYSLLTYIEGDQAELLLSNYSNDEQYQMGLKMGMALKRIHSIDFTYDNNWEETYTKKIHSRIKNYHDCPIKSDKIDEVIAFVLKHLYLLKERPICLSHGDFHSGNMIITPKGDISIIDFNRVKYGDPYYEYNRLYFSYRISPIFAKGQIDGYFNHNIPDDFFLYFKFYILSVIIGNIAWASGFGDEDVRFALKSIDEIYEDYDGLNATLPKWYKSINH